MADFEVTCSVRSVCRASGHVVAVQVDGRELTVQQVYHLMDRGDTFHTVAPRTGQRAGVREWDCSCGKPTLRSARDATDANDLDHLVCPPAPTA